MDLENIKVFLGKDWIDTESLIISSLKSEIELLNSTNKVILSHSGKQLRPILALLVARACSGGHTTSDSIRFAAASELLHNATLLHDDVADSSPERRGIPTVMSVLGGPAAVLIGDFWLVKAMERILEASVHGDIVIRLFSRTLSDLAEGEILQLQKAENGDTEESDYLRIIYNKTASLFVAASVSAAISVGANKRMKEAVKEYAADLGIAFQIKDDIFDYSENASIGKPVGIDLKERKITLPLIGALSNVDTETAGEIRRKVCRIGDDPSYASDIRRFVIDNGGMEYAGRKLEEYVCKGIIALKALPESDEKKYLKSLAEFVADRKS